MKNKSILVVIALCAGLQSGVVFGSQQTWGEWAYDKAAAAGNYAYAAMAPYINRAQRVAQDQLNQLYVAAQKEAGLLGEKLYAEAQNQVAAMMPQIQDAILKGDFEGARNIATDAAANFGDVVRKNADNTAITAQNQLKAAANKAFADIQKNTMKEINAAELASMRK